MNTKKEGEAKIDGFYLKLEESTIELYQRKSYLSEAHIHNLCRSHLMHIFRHEIPLQHDHLKF